MCKFCRCPDICGCNPTCFCGMIIPLKVGTVLAAIQIMLCGFSFPVMSVLFWPQLHILIPSVTVAVLVLSFAVLLLVNMKLNKYIIFRIVIYGILFAFTTGCVVIVIGLHVDFGRSTKEFRESLQKLFNYNTRERIASQMLHSMQILYFSALFFSYVYCGMVFQLYEMTNKKTEVEVWRRPIVTVLKPRKEDVKRKVSVVKSPGGEPGVHPKQPKEKTVRIVLHDP